MVFSPLVGRLCLAPAATQRRGGTDQRQRHPIDVTVHDFLEGWNFTEQFGPWHAYPFERFHTNVDNGEVTVTMAELTNRLDAHMNVDSRTGLMQDVLLVYGPFGDVRDPSEAFALALEVVRPHSTPDQRWDVIEDLLPDNYQGPGHLEAGHGEAVVFDDLIIALAYDQSIIPARSYSHALHFLIASLSDREYADHLL